MANVSILEVTKDFVEETTALLQECMQEMFGEALLDCDKLDEDAVKYAVKYAVKAFNLMKKSQKLALAQAEIIDNMNEKVEHLYKQNEILKDQNDQIIRMLE